MSVTTIIYGAYTAMTVTNLQSLANAAADPFAGWQSDRVSNLASNAMDYNILVDCSTAATATNNDRTFFVFVVPWTSPDNGTTWIPGGNFGTTTAPTGVQGTATLTEPNSMSYGVAIPYKTTSQRLQAMFSIVEVLGFMPDGWSLAARNSTGAALGTGCVVSHRSIKYDVS